jgi:transcription termination/antitermination protein NusG
MEDALQQHLEPRNDSWLGNLLAEGPAWYVIHTRSRNEAKVESALRRKGIEIFLPKVMVRSRRQDRKLFINVPLFPGYLFACANLDSYGYREIFKAPGVVQILGNGSPIPVPEETVDSIRAIVESDKPSYPWPYLQTGSLVRVLDGPLAGTVGVILGRNDKKRHLIVSVELFQRSVAVQLDSEAIECWS